MLGPKRTMIWSLLLFCTLVLAANGEDHPCFNEMKKNKRVQECAMRVAASMRDRPRYGGMFSRGRRGAQDGDCFNTAYGSNRNCLDQSAYMALWSCWWDRDTAMKQNMRVVGITSRDQG
ncbi:hypothetical protein MTO96_009323 [Rhipicephalus appendiculatus]